MELKIMEITKNGTIPSAYGPEENFTGQARIDGLFRPQEKTRTLGVTVTFEPSARTAWHTHPRGQTLIVLSGKGLVQSWGEPTREIHPGDVVWCPPGEKHWHGASEDVAMSHIAIVEMEDGSAVDWMEKVTDEQYSGQTE